MSGPLLVFDFDHTIADLNTDVEVQKLAPGGEVPASSLMDEGWTKFMDAVFKLLHENNVKKTDILGLMAGLELTPNMESLLRRAIKELSATIIIISDSNTEFISHILQEKGLSELITQVITNPASWTEDGRLTVAPYHHSDMDKGEIIEDYLKTCGKKYSFVCYVGDGRNDFKAAMKLTENDLMCVREGYSLQKYIPQKAEEGHLIRAETIYWSDAEKIYQRLVEKSQNA